MVESSFYEPADIEIHVKGKGMVLRDRSLIAVAAADGKILAVGEEAKNIGKNTKAVQVISPLRRGRIADYSAASAMFRCMIKKVRGKNSFRRLHIAVCVPGGMTEVEKKALEDALHVSSGGIKELTIYEGGLEEFMDGTQQHRLEQYAAYDILIGITKDAPEKYVSEMVSDVLDYAQQQGISAERVEKILKAAVEKTDEDI